MDKDRRRLLTITHMENLKANANVNSVEYEFVLFYLSNQHNLQCSNKKRGMTPPEWSPEKRQIYHKWRNSQRYHAIKHDKAWVEAERERKRKWRKGEVYAKYVNDNRKKFNKRSRESPGVSYSFAKLAAKQGKRELSLTRKEWVFICGQPCYYCGVDYLPRVGVDRVDNDIGYHKDNVVPCCRSCNYGKGWTFVYEFLSQCNAITLFQSVGRCSSTTSTRCKNLRGYGYWKKECESRSKVVTLNEQEHTSLVEANCHYCGMPDSRGIDRMDNDLGYHKENCVSCCKTCNYMKRGEKYDAFLARTARISARFGYLGTVPPAHPDKPIPEPRLSV
jgi:hypothetical protein